MHGYQLLHKFLQKALPEIHLKRLNAVVNATQALILGKELTLTQLGRNLSSTTKERHNIRKMDRLLGNKLLHQEIPDFYQAISNMIINKMSRPIILVDWSATDKRKDWHILRASISIKGRAQVLYQEIHPYKHVNNNTVHKRFLLQLKKYYPKIYAQLLLLMRDFVILGLNKYLCLALIF
jgi:hypothetical protein